MTRARWTAISAATTLALLACNKVESVLSVTDPDIINPSDVQSAAGAEASRIGALARLNAATSGDEGLFLLGGLFTDEFINGDSFIDRQGIDQRVITEANSFLTTANRLTHRPRLSAEQAIGLIRTYAPTAPVWKIGEMYFVEAYIENLVAEHYCNGLVFSDVVDAQEVYGSPMTTQAAFERALAHADSGLAVVTGTGTDDVRVRNALKVTKGRILLNLNRAADAALAVNGVPTTFKLRMLHSATTSSNTVWSLNNLNRRYSVSSAEGTNGMNFGTANDPRVPVCQGGDVACRAVGVTQTSRDDLGRPFAVQLIWPARDSAVTIVGGIEARMIEAEAQLKTDATGATTLATLNAARATVTGLTPLVDAGSQTAREDQLFRERAFWFFGTGHRMGDMRRLIRQYQRAANTVFPTGAWHKGGNYGSDVNFPVPQAELNNPQVSSTCIDRNA
jgi:starch-binding outer membrane protein, SusD/RagB family